MGRSIGGRKVEPLETPTLITVSSCESLRRCRRWSARCLWAAQLTPELGGQGMDQVAPALLHEVLGRTLYARSRSETMPLT